MAGLGELLLATLAFVGGHFLLSALPVRTPLVDRVGERAFTGLYSLVMIVLIAWMVGAFSRAPYVPLWPPAGWSRSLVAVVMPFVTLLFVGSLTVRNPTMVFGR